MDHSKIMRAAGNLYLADMIATALDQIRPHAEKHRKQIARMQRELLVMRNEECRIADRECANGKR